MIIFFQSMDQKDMEAAFDAGVTDANNAIDNKTTIDDLIHYHALKKTGNHGVKGHTYGSFVEAKQRGEIEQYDIMKDIYMRKYTYKVMQDWLYMHFVYQLKFKSSPIKFKYR